MIDIKVLREGGVRGIVHSTRKHSLLMRGRLRRNNKRVAEDILERSKYYVPVDTGELRDSGKVVEPKGVLGLLKTEHEVVYEAPYAMHVHERTDIPHKHPTQAKYLEQAAEDAGQSVSNLVETYGFG